MNSTTENSAGNHPERSRSSGGMKDLARTSAPLTVQIARLLTLRRVRAHALILALCLWGVCAIDYANRGLYDRAGNLKFQDFLQFPISAHLIAQGHANDLYNSEVLAEAIRQITGRTNIDLKYFYGPQVALPFTLLDGLPFLTQAEIWVGLSLVVYLACVYFISKSCRRISSNGKLVGLCALAYPPVFHFFTRGQLSAAAILCVALAYLSFRAGHAWLAGLALGCLAFKPQFLVAIPLILLLAKAWNAFAGVAISAAAQLAFGYAYFGDSVMRAYFSMLLHSAGHPGSTELKFSATQMHSLYSFWELLIPWPTGIWITYFISSLIVIALATRIWRSPSPLSLRFSALLLAAVLFNPHIYIYDLLILAPMFLLVTEWSIENADDLSTSALRVFLYLSFILLLFGPLARWTHVQLSVMVFASLLWTLDRITARSSAVLQ